VRQLPTEHTRFRAPNRISHYAWWQDNDDYNSYSLSTDGQGLKSEPQKATPRLLVGQDSDKARMSSTREHLCQTSTQN